jgi:anti-sigma B factor antagonist
VSGEIDMSTVQRLQDAALATGQPAGLTIDLSGVSFMDSSGLQALVEISARAEEHGGRLVLRSVPRSAQRLFDITGLRGLWDEDEATSAPAQESEMSLNSAT